MLCQAHDFEDRIRTKDVIYEEQINFNALLLSEETIIGLQNNGFRVPSPIQVKAIPIGRCGFDLIVKSKSGTGKTVVFSVIALELINVSKNCLQVLILSPTREIAVQIQQVLKSLGSEFKGLRVESFIGGLPIDEDKKKLAKCHIAVGAPGRIKHLLQMGALKCNGIKLFILDEADKLINADSMKNDIEFLSKSLPSTKQVLACSATFSDDVMTYLESIMSCPTLVEPSTDTPLLLGLKQFVSVVKSNLNVLHQLNIKNEELIRLLSQITFSQCLVFTNYQARAESISNTLNRKGWNSMYISAAQTQTDRLKVINLLKEGKCRILLSTDITARGIDVANIDLVINYDVPCEASTYLHRMGRAGRFGSQGICITIAAQGKDLDEYCKILGTIGGRDLFVSQLPIEGNFPNDLWNADNSCFKLVQATVHESINASSKTDIVSSITNLKLQRKNSKESKSKVKGMVHEKEKVNSNNDDEKNVDECLEMHNTKNEEDMQMLNLTTDVDMPNIIETILNNSKKKEEDIKAKLVKENTFTLLQSLAAEQEIPKIRASNTDMHLRDNLLNEVALDISASKKRKRPIYTTITETTDSNEKNQHFQIERKLNSNQLMCKNLALLQATKLLYEIYDANKLSDDVVAALDDHLISITKDRFDDVFLVYSKKHILETIANESIKKMLGDLVPNQNNTTTYENVDKSCNANLEDIFKLSYDYAINCQEIHWLDVLGAELLEKISITEKPPDNGPNVSLSDADVSLLEVPKKRKQKSHKKKTFKDFTHRNKKNKDDTLNNQHMETYDDQDIRQTETQVDQNDYYQAGLYSDYEYATNEHFTSSFDYYSSILTEKLQTFGDVESFESWFAQWQWQVQGVRDYVQQNVYLQEMSRYAYNTHS